MQLVCESAPSLHSVRHDWSTYTHQLHVSSLLHKAALLIPQLPSGVRVMWYGTQAGHPHPCTTYTTHSWAGKGTAFAADSTYLSYRLRGKLSRMQLQPRRQLVPDPQPLSWALHPSLKPHLLPSQPLASTLGRWDSSMTAAGRNGFVRQATAGRTLTLLAGLSQWTAAM